MATRTEECRFVSIYLTRAVTDLTKDVALSKSNLMLLWFASTACFLPIFTMIMISEGFFCDFMKSSKSFATSPGGENVNN